MKKLLSIVLTLALALSLSVPVFAADTQITERSSEKTGKTDVQYIVNSIYTVTIPEKVTVNDSAVTVKADGVKVDYGQAVVVKLTGINVTDTNEEGDTAFKVALTDDPSQTLAYTVSASGNVDSSDPNGTNSNVSGRDISRNDVVLTVESGLNNETKDGAATGASTGSTSLSFALANPTAVKYAGTYTGTVTFTVSVKAPDVTP